jgi:hypothetical protein
MRRLALTLAVALATAVPALAQPTLTPSVRIINPGAATTLTITGPAGQSFALIGSTTWGGFSYAGVALSVGTDVQIVTIGTLDGSGQAVVPFTPPFPAQDRFYLQAVTSANGFATIAASNRVTLVNSQEARLFMPIGGLVNAAGTVIFASPGVSVSLAGNVFTIDHPNQFEFTNPIPVITPTGGATIQSLSTNASQTVVTLSGPGGIAFIIDQVRR